MLSSSAVAAGNRKFKFSEENSQNISNSPQITSQKLNTTELPQEEKNRGKRMMGVLMGTLSKFKSEEVDKSEANLKRILLEQRLAQKLAQAKEILEQKQSNTQDSMGSVQDTPEMEHGRVFYSTNIFQTELQQIKTVTSEACAEFERTQAEPVLYFKRAE
jgi:hypothetical protein